MSGMRRAAAVALALLALAAAFAARARLLPAAASDAVYAPGGLALLHRVAPEGVSVNAHMPLLSLAMAQLSGRLDPAAVSVWSGRLALALAAAAAADLALTAALPTAAAAGTAAVAVLLLATNGGSSMMSLYSLLVLLAAAALAWRDESPSRSRTAAAAAAVGVTLLYRSPLAFLPPLLAVRALASRHGRRDPWDAALMLVVPYLFLLPWLRLNWVLEGRLIPFENGEAHTNIVTGALGLVRTIEGGYAPLLGRALPDDRLATVLAWAVREIAAHPGRYAAAFAGRLAYAWTLHPWLCAAALAAAWVLRARPGWSAYARVAAYFAGMHCLMSVQSNYFDPLWPLLGVLAAGLVVEGLRRAGAAAGARWRASEAALLLLLLGAGGAAARTLSAVGAYVSATGRRPPASQRAWDEALARSPDDGWLLFESGRRALRAGDAAGAVARLSRALSLAPRRAERELWLDWALYRSGKPRPILEWRTPSEADPAMGAAADALQAVAFLKAGRREKARRALGAALAARDDFLEMRTAGRPAPPPEVAARLRRSSTMLLIEGGDLPPLSPEERLSLARELAALSPDWAELSLQRAALAVGLGRRAEAREALTSAEAGALNREQWLSAALLRQQLGDFQKALGIFARLLAEKPEPALLADKGLCESLAGRPAEAESDLREALRLEPGAASASLTLGAVLMGQGRLEEAARVYDAALRAGPGDEGLRALLASSRAELAR